MIIFVNIYKIHHESRMVGKKAILVPVSENSSVKKYNIQESSVKTIKAPVEVEKLDPFNDNRGQVFNPVEIDTLIKQKNCHVVISVPGAVRGNHYHPKGTEIIVITGPADVRVRQHGTLRDITIPAKSVYRLTIPPGVSHAVKHTGNENGVLLSFGTVPYDPDHPDMVPDLLL